MSNKSWPLSKDELDYFYRDKKFSGEKIAKLFNITSGTVAYWRKKYGIDKVESWERHDLPTELSKLEKEVVLGYVLGDGYIGNNSRHSHLRVSQSCKQKRFVEQLYNYLLRWAAYTPKIDGHIDDRYKKEYFSCRFDTVAHPVFDYLYGICYTDGIKTVTSKWLSEIGPCGLAMWYQGDGQLNSGNVTPKLNTNGFSLSEHKLIAEWFKVRFGIRTYLRLENKYYKICIIDGMEFRKIVEPYIIQSFVYKLPNSRSRKEQKRIIDKVTND